MSGKATTLAMVVAALIGGQVQGAWIGDVPDLANPIYSNTLGAGVVCVESTGGEYTSLIDALAWCAEGDTLLMGPGLYQEWNNNTYYSPASPPWIWTISISLKGSGSAADGNTNTV